MCHQGMLGVPSRNAWCAIRECLVCHQGMLGVRSGSAWCRSVQKSLSSSLPSKNIKIKIYCNIILPVVLYGCETWSLDIKEGG